MEAPVADADARITRMKDGRTHLAHKAEHAVVETGAVSVTVQGADRGDTQTMVKTLEGGTSAHPDKGYQQQARMVDLDAVGLLCERTEAREATLARRPAAAGVSNASGERGQRLLRQRGERLERPCAHLYGSGGMRRLHVRGHENVLKRLLIQVSAFNLGMLMRQSLGVGTPRGLQGRICALMLLILSLFKRLKGLFGLIPAAWPEKPNSATPSLLPSVGTT